jgi:membrane-associated phospholipid phosphatase
VPALSPALARSLLALGALGAGFVLYTQAVAAGLTAPLDLEVARAAAAAWLPALQPLPQAIAVLGGIEVTAALAVAMAVLLWRGGFGVEAAALLALPGLWALELVYKWEIRHPPPVAFSHPDGPSLVTMLHGGTLTLNGSYPSGHMMRSVLIYGFGAFVVRRLSSSRVLRGLAAPGAAVVVGLVALDRVYLGAHWQSDVLGGLLLGGAALAATIAWLDRPRAPA